MQEKLPGRPLGPIAESVLELLIERGPLTSREIAATLQLSSEVARDTCRRLESRGRIRIVARLKIKGINKSVARYNVTRQLNSSANTRLFNFQF